MSTTFTEDQLLYFAILNWTESNRPYPRPEGGYVIDIKNARLKLKEELDKLGEALFIIKHNVTKFTQPKKEKRMAWDEAKKADAIKRYQDAKPTPENSIEVVKEIAEEIGETPNGVRMILSKAGVYVKKEASEGKAAASGDKAPRVSKADSIAALKEVIEATGSEADDELLEKLTGKQAIYLTGIIKSLIK